MENLDRTHLQAVLAAVTHDYYQLMDAGDPALQADGMSIGEEATNAPPEIEGSVAPEHGHPDAFWAVYFGRRDGRWNGGAWNLGNGGYHFDAGPRDDAEPTAVARWIDEQFEALERYLVDDDVTGSASASQWW